MIELFGPDFAYCRPVDTAIKCGYADILNDMPTAELTLAADDPVNGEIVVPASWLRLTDGARRPQMYRFSDIDPEEHGEGGKTLYHLEGAEATLLDDMLIGWHELGGTDMPTRQVLSYILDRQTVKRWQLGRCDFADQYQYNFEDVTLLEAIMSLGEVLLDGYQFQFIAEGPPPWTLNLVRLDDAPASQITMGRNAQRIRRTVDGRIVTRLVGRGYGEGDNQLTISKVNGGVDYLDADTLGTWGVRVGIHVDRRQTDPETLKARMAAILEAGKNPRIAYEADAVDLYGLTGERWDDHEAGERVMILDERMPGVVMARITERRKPDMEGDPGGVQLVLDNAVRDTAEELNEVLDKIGVQELYSQGATNMYSQQVTETCDPEHPLAMKFYVPGNVLRINSCLLTWQVRPFRSNVKLAKSGGGSTKTSAEGGGATVSTPQTTISYSNYSGGTIGAGHEEAEPLTGGACKSDGQLVENTKGPSSNETGGPNVSDTGLSAGTLQTDKSSSSLSTGTPNGAVPSHTHHVNQHRHFIPEHSHSLAGHTHTMVQHTHNMQHYHNMQHRHSIAHTHTIPPMEFELSGHTHSVTIPAHEHELTFGIYESTRAQTVRLRVDGADAGELAEKELDVAALLRKNQDGRVVRSSWHEIEFIPDALTGLTVNLFFQVFIQSRGAGDF